MFKSLWYEMRRFIIILRHGRAHRIFCSMLAKYFLYQLNRVFIKKSNLWLAGAWTGRRYADNPRYLFEYVLECHPEVQMFWVAFNQEIYQQVSNLNKPVVYAYSLRGIWCLLRAKVYMFDSSLKDIAWFGAGEKTFCMQFWHGSPLKKINYDSLSHREKYYNKDDNYHLYLHPYELEYYNAVPAPSKHYQAIFRSAFRLHCRHFPILGYPRIDRLLSHVQPYSYENPRILYAPTFRGIHGMRIPLGDKSIPQPAQFERLNQLFFHYNAAMDVQYHPTDTVSPKIEGFERITPVVRCDDFYAYFAKIDILITDYSSLMLDFILTKKPVICVVADIDVYVSEHRELYCHPAEIPGVQICKTWDDLPLALENIFKYGPEAESSQKNELLREVYALQPGESLRRTVKYLKRAGRINRYKR